MVPSTWSTPPRRPTPAALAARVALTVAALAATAQAWAGPVPLAGSPPPDPVPIQVEPVPPIPLPLPDPPPFADPFALPSGPRPLEPSQDSWLDEGHSILEQSLFWPILRLDHFFSDGREVEADMGRSFILWRNDLKVRGDGTFGYATSARADLRFPFLSRKLERLRLTLSGETVDAVDRLLPPDTTATPTAGGVAPTASLRAALGYQFFESIADQGDAQVGLLFRLPVGWYAKLRWRHAQPLGDVALSRLAVAGFWQTNTGWGTRQDADLERRLHPHLVVRHANTGTVTQRSRGWEWGSELSLISPLTETSAISLSGAATGATHVGPVVEVYRVSARARRDLYRRWFFVELEPQVTWTRPLGGGRVRGEAVILRLEVQFEEPGARAPRW